MLESSANCCMKIFPKNYPWSHQFIVIITPPTPEGHMRKAPLLPHTSCCKSGNTSTHLFPWLLAAPEKNLSANTIEAFTITDSLSLPESRLRMKWNNVHKAHSSFLVPRPVLSVWDCFFLKELWSVTVHANTWNLQVRIHFYNAAARLFVVPYSAMCSHRSVKR